MRLAGPANAPITLSLSLLTKELSIARGRSAAMTAHSEKVRMSLYRRIAQEGLTFEQQKQLGQRPACVSYSQWIEPVF